MWHGFRDSSTAHCPKVVRQCTEGDPLPTSLGQCGRLPPQLHSHFPRAVLLCTVGIPMPPPHGTVAVCCKSSMAHYPKEVRLCTNEFHCRSAGVYRGFPLPNAQR